MSEILDREDPNGVHWVPIIDVGIPINTPESDRGLELDIFVYSGNTNEPLVGNVWPGDTYYPDFNHPNSSIFWTEGIGNLTTNYNMTPSGIWIDMNEFANFVNGEIGYEEDT